MNRINLRASFWFILILSSSLFAQETHNLEIIWTGRWPASVTGVPESYGQKGSGLES
jgi:hypothetical protein